MSNTNDQPDWDELPTRAMTPESGGVQGSAHHMPGQGQPAQEGAGQYGAQPAQDAAQQYGSRQQGRQNPYGQQGGQDGSQPQGQSNQYGSQNQAGQYGHGGPLYSQNQPGATQQYGQQYGQPTPATKVGTSGPKGLGAKASWTAVVLGAFAILGTFGTWAHLKMASSVPTFRGFDVSANGLGSVSGGDGLIGRDGYKTGWIILVLALIAIGVAVMRALGRLPKATGWGTAAAGAVITIIAFLKWFQIYRDFDIAKDVLAGENSGIDFNGSPGWGIMVCFVAGVLLIVAGALSALRD